MDATLLGEVVVTLIVIMDPPGNVPMFPSVGPLEASPEQRTSIAMVPLGTPLLAGPA